MSIYIFNDPADYKKINDFCVENGFTLKLNNVCLCKDNIISNEIYLKNTLFSIIENKSIDVTKSKLELSYNVFSFDFITYDEKIKNNTYVLAYYSSYNVLEILEKCKNLNSYREIKLIRKNYNGLENTIYFCFSNDLNTEDIFDLLNSIYSVSKKENLKTIDYKKEKLF